MTQTVPLRTGPLNPGLLFWYLDRFCHRDDRVTFFDAAGQPDLIAARAYAEELRTRLALAIPDWASFVTVTQRNHEVILVSNLAVPKHANAGWYRATRDKMVSAQAKAAAKAEKTGSREYAFG
jgi:hypothetical protein